MLRIFAISLFFLLGLIEVTAQQLPQFQQYRNFGFVVNPAMSGVEGDEVVGLMYRYQWTKMPKAPMTAFATFDTHRFREDYNMALSGYFVHDRVGPSMTNGIGINYAYSIEMESWGGESHFISFGVQANFAQFRLNGNELIVNDIEDPLVIGDKSSSFLPDLGAGIFYYNSFMGFGFSAPQLLGLTSQFKADGDTSPIGREQHLYGQLYGKIPLGHYEENFLMPSIWAKYSFHSPLHLDFNLRALLNEWFIVGVGFATSKMVTGELGVYLNEQYRFGYSYSTQFTAWNSFLGDSHEIHFSFILDSDNWGYY